MKKRTFIPYLLFVLAAVAVLVLMFKTRSLQQKVDKNREVQDSLTTKITDYEAVFQVDSMLIDGDYNQALQSYSENLGAIQDGKSILPLRIAVAEKMKQLNRGANFNSSGVPDDRDTLAVPNTAGKLGVRQADSLSFALEKAKVELNNLRRQLQLKSFGEYLTFKSKKGNLLHYVGQVKNGQANGTGIAILDTGSRYEGEWKNNQRSGRGIFYWADGQHYEGSYANDMRNGLGTYYWPNKEKYVGQWKNDKRDGQGAFYGADGKVVAKGIWKADKLEKDDKDG
ncbi:hypothetical protein FGM00_07355 [Aggregatimonas sangjinii]|uniref:MORN repeat-containing protein n=1 Tax=Aggregatimonas sangjinii TaxID=2583587 RepID=A0A5B7SMP2_9FLAO|nr:hypothetical protein [Aggregatimonas sangjinii]QCW99924.1 hypothetical protein FGM00_07355 [Aggregatimonas sangjinii]